MLATPDDLRLELESQGGSEFFDEDAALLRLAQATDLVESFMGRSFAGGEVPGAIRRVTAAVAARPMIAPPGSGFTAESVSAVSGPFSHNVRFASGASSGGPWLTAQDKIILRRFRKRRRVVSVELS